MNEIKYFDFLGGKSVTIRSITNQYNSEEEGLTYFDVALEETNEIIKLSVNTENASKIKEETIISFSATESAIGYCLWKNGNGPFEINC